MRQGLVALMLLAVIPARAAALGPICPDRPGKGTSPCTVASGRAQLEVGLGDESFQRRDGVTINTGNAGALLAKYGVGDGLDIEAGMTLYQFQRSHSAADTMTARGAGDLFLRAKYNPLTSEGPFAMALAPFLKLPTAGTDLGNGAVEGGLVLPLSYDLGSDWAVSMTPEADLLRDSSGSGHHAGLSDVLGVSRSFGPLTLGAEIWTSQNLEPGARLSQYSFDLDAAYLIGNDTQLDGGINLGLNRATADTEIYFGISHRF